jgi:hypothetical protein
MKRTYTCIREIRDEKGNTLPEIFETNRQPEVMRWMKEHGVDTHSNDAIAGKCIHQCRDGSWAIILCNGKTMILKHDVVLYWPTGKVRPVEETAV